MIIASIKQTISEMAFLSLPIVPQNDVTRGTPNIFCLEFLFQNTHYLRERTKFNDRTALGSKKS